MSDEADTDTNGYLFPILFWAWRTLYHETGEVPDHVAVWKRAHQILDNPEQFDGMTTCRQEGLGIGRDEKGLAESEIALMHLNRNPENFPDHFLVVDGTLVQYSRMTPAQRRSRLDSLTGDPRPEREAERQWLRKRIVEDGGDVS